jgi:hypothetical protein
MVLRECAKDGIGNSCVLLIMHMLRKQKEILEIVYSN